MTDGAPRRPFTDVWSRSSDGLRLHGRLYGGETGHLPVVGLPGLTRNAAEFDGLATRLAASGPARRFLAVDYRGRGGSDYDPDPSHYSIPVETADLLTVLAELGIRRAIFVGVSRGGLISMGLAAARPELVAGIVLNDIGPVIEREGLLRIKGYAGRLGVPTDWADAEARLRQRFASFFPSFDDDDWAQWARSTWVERDGGLVADYDPTLAATLEGVDETSPIPEIWPVFDAIGPIPMLLIRGELSDLLSRASAEEMARRKPGLDLVEVAGAGHTPLLHRPPAFDRITALIRRVDEAERTAALPSEVA